jgi:Fur family transcriptional regulator, peroxide stress response regulator
MYRQTKQREAILRVLKNTRAHPTADSIYEKVKEEMPHISKGTVYRNLKVLQDTGQISELKIQGTLSRYEAKQEAHYHFRCEKCGRVIDLDEPVNHELNGQVAGRTGFQILSHKIEFGGLCRDCMPKWSKKYFE